MWRVFPNQVTYLDSTHQAEDNGSVKCLAGGCFGHFLKIQAVDWG